MFIGAGCYFTQFKVDKKVMSKEEAVQLISQKIREAPSIQWVMSLGEARARSESSEFCSASWINNVLTNASRKAVHVKQSDCEDKVVCASKIAKEFEAA